MKNTERYLKLGEALALRTYLKGRNQIEGPQNGFQIGDGQGTYGNNAESTRKQNTMV